jgi:hypothetical protein
MNGAEPDIDSVARSISFIALFAALSTIARKRHNTETGSDLSKYMILASVYDLTNFKIAHDVKKSQINPVP